ncbi:unnamed protein product [Brassica oleracea]
MTENGQNIANGVVCRKTTLNTMRMDENLLKIVRKYEERIMLKESDLLPRISKKKTRRRGGDGCPKLLLDVEGLAKHLRCVGIDAAVPPSKKPDSRAKRLLKNEQLLDVIETFQLKISENQLMSRCTKCNGRFIQKPLTIEEAIEAAKGFQRIPNCLFNKNLEFWQCMNCHQLYWEGTQYHNAVQKFMDVCKLSE